MKAKTIFLTVLMLAYLLGFNMKTSGDGAGISCGKWDENRQVAPYTIKQRMSGINAPYMRISEVFLALAESALMKTSPDQSTADSYYNLTHMRAGLGTKSGVTLEDISMSAASSSLVRAIVVGR